MTDESTPKLLKWRGAKIYRCRLCAFDSTDKKKFEHHFAIAHPPLRIIDGGKDEPVDKSLHEMTREELNIFAGWFGLTTDAESFATKADLIAAIEAEQKGTE